VGRNGMHGVGKLLLLVALAIPAGLISGPFAVIGVWAVLSVATSLWEYDRLRREIARRAPIGVPSLTDRRAGFAELREGFGLQVVGTLSGSLPPQVLPIFVIGILGQVEAGWFSITWLVGSLCFMISPSVCQALLAEGSLRPDELDARTRAAIALSSGLLAAPLVVYVFFGSAVLGLFGSSYAANGTTLLVILAISSIPDLVTNVGVARYRVQRRLAPAAAVNGVIAVVTITGTAWAVGGHGIDAVGWSWMAGQVAGCGALVTTVALDRRAKVGATRAVPAVSSPRAS
jgi:O-antigen/teichoic acid export membrane protein